MRTPFPPRCPITSYGLIIPRGTIWFADNARDVIRGVENLCIFYRTFIYSPFLKYSNESFSLKDKVELVSRRDNQRVPASIGLEI